MLDPVKLLQKLISFPSVTPDDAGSMAWLVENLEALGFTCTPLDFATKAPTKNLYATLGEGLPNLCFAGHLDVVPPGPEDKWGHKPFSGDIADGMVYGRGAVDMKGALACFISALSRFLESGKKFSSISLLITADEEGTGEDGMVKVVEHLKANKIAITDCLIGEPTSVDSVADMIKIGRRGSINFALTVHGKQGHVAYPDLADNPIGHLMEMLYDLKGHAIDLGYDFFQPSHLEITSIDVGNNVANVIPADASAKFNIRFNPHHTAASLAAWAKTVCDKHEIAYDLTYASGSEAFLSSKGVLYEVVLKAVADVTSHAPRVTTSGGTSDARFIKDLCPVVELGLTNEKAHHIDEAVSIADLNQLSEVYYQILTQYFKG